MTKSEALGVILDHVEKDAAFLAANAEAIVEIKELADELSEGEAEEDEDEDEDEG